MSQFHPPGLPGTKTKVETSPRNVFLSGPELLPSGIVIDGSKSRDPLNTGHVDTLRDGLVLGKITASGMYAPTIIGVLTEAFDTDGSFNTTMMVSAATATEIVRRIGSSGTFKAIGPPTAAGVVASTTVTFSNVNTSTGAITVTDPNVDKIAGTFICATDGSEEPLGLLTGNNGTGVKVTDVDGNSVDVPAQLAIGGMVAASGIINYPTDTSLLAWLKSKLNGGDGTENAHGPFKFVDRFQPA